MKKRIHTLKDEINLKPNERFISTSQMRTGYYKGLKNGCCEGTIFYVKVLKTLVIIKSLNRKYNSKFAKYTKIKHKTHQIEPILEQEAFERLI